MHILRSLQRSSLFLVTATAVAQPIIEPERLTIDFGDLEPNETNVTVEVDIFARGDQPLTIGQIGATDVLEAPFDIRFDTCSGATLEPSQKCVFDVVVGNATLGISEDTFNIPSNDPLHPNVTVDVRVRVFDDILNGRVQGFRGPAVQVCESLDSGAIDVAMLDPPVEWNCGISPIQLGTRERFHARVFGVAAGATFGEEFFARFSDHRVAGRLVDVSVRPSPVDYGNLMMIDGETVEEVVVRNTGDDAVFVREVATTDRLTPPFGVITDNCSFATLARGATCNVILRFDEPAVSGAYAETFSLTVEGTQGAPELITVPVSGTRNGVILGARAFGALERDFYCLNRTTGQFLQESGAIANCKALGFNAAPGDLVQVGVVGVTNE